jgi:hypothetical protein
VNKICFQDCLEDYSGFRQYMPENKKALPNGQKSFDMFDIFKLGSDLSVPSRMNRDGWNWHLASAYAEKQVVKASQGHYPQPFLISN